MRWLIRSGLRLAVAMAAAVVLVMFLGVSALRHAPVDTLPEFLPPQVQVQTEALGLSAAEVEQLITVPLEDEFNGIAYLDRLRSQSVPGLSSIELTFKPGTDIYTARQLVTERVAQGPAVVNVGTPPVMIQPLSAEGRAMMIGLSSKDISPIDLSTLARWRIRPRLLAVPGVANVTIWGQRDQQLQVLVDPARMHGNGVTLTQVVNTTGDAMWTSPLTFVEASSPGTDGFIDMPNQRLSVQHILPITGPADLATVPVEDTAGKPVRLGDVATVVEDHPALRGDAVLKNGPGLLLVVEKFPGANTLAVSRGVKAAMADLAPGLTGVSVDTTVFQPATFIETALRDLGRAALAGLALAVIWLGLCWRSWRIALISLVAITLPLVAAAYVLLLAGVTFTAMTLAGFALAAALVIDDAVTAVHAINRRLVATRDTGTEPSRAEVITEACLDVRRPLSYALAVLLLAAVPLLLLTAAAGSFARPVMIAYLLALVISTLVALIVTPPLAYLLLTSPSPRLLAPAALRRGSRIFERVFSRVALRRGRLFGCVGLLATLGVAVFPQLGQDSLIPAIQDRNLLVRWQAPPGTSLTAMQQTASSAGDALRALPGVRNVASDLGQALMGDQIVDVNAAQTWITVAPRADYGSTLAAIRRTLDSYHGLQHTLLTYPQASLDAAHPANASAITVRVFGTDAQTMATQAEAIRRLVSTVPGIVDSAVRSPTLEPTIQIQTDVAAAAGHGLKPGDVRRATSVLVAGIPVGSYYQQQQIFDVAVWSEPANRANLADLQNLTVDAPGGGQVALKDIATVSVKPAATEIDHDDASRYIDITAAVRGADLDTVVGRVGAAVQAHPLPLGYRAEVSSDLAQRQRTDLRTLIYVLAVAAGILLLLQAAFHSWSRAALLFAMLPLAGSGGVLTALIAGSPMTVGALLGFITVIGLALRHGTLLVRRLQSREADHGDRLPADLVRDTARQAAFPTTATAVAAALALLPFVVRGDIAGMEILRPFGLVVLGGLVTSTLVTLFVLPGLYLQLPMRPRRSAA